MASPCPDCGSGIAPGDRYCGNCGLDLGLIQEMSSKKQKVNKTDQGLQRYLPEETIKDVLTESKLHKPGVKKVTVIICELDETTTFLKDMEKNEACTIKEKVLDLLMRKINEYGGTVNQILDDKMIGFFGGAFSITNASQRAVQAAWSVHREMLRFNEKIRKDPPVGIKIGIHRGLVNILGVDEDMRISFSDEDQTVKLVHHILDCAEAGNSTVTDEIYRIVDGCFKFEKIESRHIADIGREIRLYKALAPMDGRKRIDRLRKGEDDSLSPNDKEAPAMLRQLYWGGTPWKSDHSEEKILSLNKRIFLFFIIFYSVLCLILALETFYPDINIAYYFHFNDNFWIKMIIIISFLFLFTYIFYKLICMITIAVLKKRGDEFKLGNILVKDGYITEEDLNEALAEQQERIGDILVKSGHISPQQLEQALESQCKSSGKFGEILIKNGYATREDVNWALGKLNRKLGEILREKGLISEHNLYWILRRQTNSVRRKRD